VESEVGSGTIFRIYLPLGDGHLEEEEKGRRGEEEMETGSRFAVPSSQSDQMVIENDDIKSSIIHHPPSIIHEKEEQPLLLIVEDNRDLRQYIRNFLDDSYAILEKGDGEKGFATAVETVPDLVISDVMMPVMDGYELCAKLKTDERTSHIPVILLTARADMESKIEGLETGADDFITKPFDALELQTRIRNLISQRKKLQERFSKNINRYGFEKTLDHDAPDMTTMDQKFLQKAVQIIDRNMSDPDYSIESLADEMALSSRQLQRKVLSITGQTPVKFIRSIRLSKAAQLLAGKTGSVTEIAYEVGFNNLSWFAKSFKEQFGVSPSEYQE
jgi:DNA-binding response OmpR family regulator